MSRIRPDLSIAPLTGRVFCCTSISSDQYTEIALKCKAMGGLCREDLRNDVMYLIVGERHTPKYEYATKNRFDIKFLTSKSILSLHEKWINGLDITNIEDELAKYKLPVFEGLLITCTNITDNQRRQEIINTIESHGGKYLSDLIKTVNIVISPVKRAGAKYGWAQKWNIPIVHPNWVQSSINIGAALDVSEFSLDIDPMKMFTGLRPRNHNNRALLSGFDEEGQEDTQLILSDSHLKVRMSGKRKKSSNKVWDDLMEVADAEMNSFSSKGFVDKWKDDIDVDENRIRAIEKEIDENDDLKVKLANKEEKEKVVKKGIFSGLIFQFYGFDEDQTLKLTHVVSTNGAFVFDIDKVLLHSEDPTHIIINSLATRYKYSELLEALPKSLIIPKIKTEWFIERSLEKRKCADDIWGDFIKIKPIPAFKNIVISVSGYSGTELLHLERLIGLIGAKFDPIFTPNNNILISTRSSRKLFFAREWRIPAVREVWLWACAKTGKLLPIIDHLDVTKYNWLLKGQDISLLQLRFLEINQLTTDASQERSVEPDIENKEDYKHETPETTRNTVPGGRAVKPDSVFDSDPISDNDTSFDNSLLTKRRKNRLEAVNNYPINSSTFENSAPNSRKKAGDPEEFGQNVALNVNIMNDKFATNLDESRKILLENSSKTLTNVQNTRLIGRSAVSITKIKDSRLCGQGGDISEIYSNEASMIDSAEIAKLSNETETGADLSQSTSVVGYSDSGSSEDKTTLLKAFNH